MAFTTGYCVCGSASFALAYVTVGAPEILQVNIGKLCNLTCRHCHVESGPTKTRENMNEEVCSETQFALSTVQLKP